MTWPITRGKRKKNNCDNRVCYCVIAGCGLAYVIGNAMSLFSTMTGCCFITFNALVLAPPSDIRPRWHPQFTDSLRDYDPGPPNHVWYLGASHPHISEPVCLWWDHLGEGPKTHPPCAHTPFSAWWGEDRMWKLRGKNGGREIAKPTQHGENQFNLLSVKLDLSSKKQKQALKQVF